MNDNLLSRSIQYDCMDEFYPAVVLQEKCEYCQEKIENHEYYLLYDVEFAGVLGEYNLHLMQEYFNNDSRAVINNARENMHKLIPFVGAGLSKSLGFPLWKELFLCARKDISSEFLAVFDKIYKDGDIDKLINFILDFHPMIQDEKDLKVRLIKPQVNKKIPENEMKSSV